MSHLFLLKKEVKTKKSTYFVLSADFFPMGQVFHSAYSVGRINFLESFHLNFPYYVALRPFFMPLPLTTQVLWQQTQTHLTQHHINAQVCCLGHQFRSVKTVYFFVSSAIYLRYCLLYFRYLGIAESFTESLICWMLKIMF